jgi:hypothetical protein
VKSSGHHFNAWRPGGRPDADAPPVRTRFCHRFLFLMDRRRLTDRIPRERPAVRAARAACDSNLFRLRDTGMIFL